MKPASAGVQRESGGVQLVRRLARRAHGMQVGALRIVLALVAALAVANAARAIDDEPPLADAALDARYRALIHEVRCLVCQNQTIADSSAPLAADLRREIRALIEAGRSDEEVVDFLVTRYGDFALYRPPFKPSTWALWGGPALFLAAGAFVFGRIVRRRAAANIEEDGE